MMTTKSKSTSNNPVPNFYRASAEDFKKIPGSPIAYWVSENVLKVFKNGTPLGDFAKVKRGMTTSDNNQFIRFWPEISFNKSYLKATNEANAIDSIAKWFPYSKGGGFRKWYGYLEFFVNWEESGRDIIAFAKTINKSYTRTIVNIPYYFQPSVGFSYITNGPFSMRWIPEGCVYDSGGPGVFAIEEKRKLIIGCMNSTPANLILKFLNPTINLQIADVVRLPLPNYDIIKQDFTIDVCISELINIAKTDWDSIETSWDFTTLPLLSPEYKSPTIKETYTKLRSHWQEMTNEMQRLEEENNRIFIEAYGLEDELTPDVPLSEITLTCNPHYRYNKNKTEEELETLLLTDTMKEFISYAVGCMFGRYSLDKPGLILANQGDHVKDYLGQVPNPSFMPDDDNIIPVLDDEYFKDDIVSRFKDFLKVTFGRETLSQNLDFIAKALSGKSTGSPEQVIRNYFIRDFYKDHLQRYKKRPIYWMFSSGKNQGFNALIYMHRYDKSTLAKMRTDYLLELESKLIAEVEMLSGDQTKNKARLTKIKNQVEEMQKYDELLNNKSLQQIEIDLDDGVKVNYEKFEGLVRGV